jgi:protein-disulfide isomerase
MPFIRHASRFLLAAALPLALAACGDKNEGAAGEAPKGDAIAKIAAPAGKQWPEVVTVTDLGGYQMGNPDAPLKLVEYASLTCSHCADFSAKAGATLRDKYVASGVVSWELRNQIHDGFDLTMAMLVRCGEPASFHALSEQVWQNFGSLVENIQKAGPALEAAMKEQDQAKRYQMIAERAGLTDFFAARGIAKDQANACLAKPGVAEKLIKQSEDQSKELDIQGTPTFFLNGNQLDDKSWEALEPILQNAGAR